MTLVSRRMQVLAATLTLVAVTSCTSPLQQEDLSTPDWLAERIRQMQAEPVANPPGAVYRYTYKGNTVYFVPQKCCDFFSELYDAKGALLCHPDGGITGNGDGKCKDFIATRKDETLIWQDPRS